MIEMVVASTILLLAVAAVLGGLDSSTRTARFADDRSQALDDMRIMTVDFGRDVRQATEATSISTSELALNTYVGGTLTQVTWRATGSRLTRTVSGGNERLYLIDLVTSAVFSYSGVVDPRDVARVRLTLATRPDARYEPVSVETDVEMRNA